jgi:hypothetical protein
VWGSFSVANLPPTIGQVTLPSTSSVNAPATLAASAIDPAGPADPLTFTWTITSPTGTPLATLTGAQVTFTPTAAGQ